MKKIRTLISIAPVLVALGITTASAWAGDRDWDSKDSKEVYERREVHEPMDRWYVAAFGGVSVGANGEGDLRDTVGAGTSTGMDVGGGDMDATAGAKLGYEFAPFGYTGNVAWLPAIELEGAWSNFNARSHIDASFPFLPVGGNNISADYTAANLMLNGLIKAKVANWFTPYIGVGVGGAWIERSHAHFNSPVPGASSVMSSSDDIVFAAQGIGGVDFMLNDRWSLFGEYKFLVFFDPTFSDNSGAVLGGVTTDAHYDWLGEHLVTAGVKYHF